MANYIIIGGDHKEYGPVSETDVRQWIAEGRLNRESRVKIEGGTEFRPLAEFPELAAILRPAGAPAPMAPGTIAPIPTADDFLNRDYELDIMQCFSQGMELFKNNMGLLLVGPLIYFLIEFGIGVLGNIPLVGTVIQLANFVCSGALVGGLYYLFLRVNRNEPAALGDIFAGFRRGFAQLFLVVLVQSLAIFACLIPAIVVLVIKLIPMFSQLQQLQHLQPGTPPDPELIKALMSLVWSVLPVALICALPATYLSVCWKFALPLIVDYQMDFGAAMKASWKMVNKHFWAILGLIILIGLLNLVGLLACCVGLLFTFPIGIAALMIAYETIFGVKKN